MIETSGVIEKEQGNGFYLVTLEQPEGHQCLCRAAGKLTKFRIKLLAGDKVLVEISPYDLTRGRITQRERNAGGSKPTTNKNNPKRNNKKKVILDNIYYRFLKFTSLFNTLPLFF